MTFKELISRIHEDWVTHNSQFTSAGFQAVAVARVGAWIEKKPRWIRKFLWIAHRPVYWWVRNVYGIELPHTVRLGRRVHLAHQSGIVIHGYATIGDDCLIRHNVTLGIGVLETAVWNEAATLGNRVQIGVGSVLVGPIKVGDGAHIGPNCVVQTDVPAGATVFAGPVRMLPPKAQPETDSSAGHVPHPRPKENGAVAAH